MSDEMDDPAALDFGFLSLPKQVQDECLAVSTPHSRTDSDLYPITIITARYGGSYEGGRYCAFHSYPSDIPWDAVGNDISCCAYWGSTAVELVGRGSTPNRALADLQARLENTR